MSICMVSVPRYQSRDAICPITRRRKYSVMDYFSANMFRWTIRRDQVMKKDLAHSFEKESSINVILLTRYSDRK